MAVPLKALYVREVEQWPRKPLSVVVGSLLGMDLKAGDRLQRLRCQRTYQVDSVGFWPVRGGLKGRKLGALMREGTWTLSPQLPEDVAGDFLVDTQCVDSFKVSVNGYAVDVRHLLDLRDVVVPDMPIPILALCFPSAAETGGVLVINQGLRTGRLLLLAPATQLVNLPQRFLLALPGGAFGDGPAFECVIRQTLSSCAPQKRRPGTSRDRGPR